MTDAVDLPKKSRREDDDVCICKEFAGNTIDENNRKVVHITPQWMENVIVAQVAFTKLFMGLALFVVCLCFFFVFLRHQMMRKNHQKKKRF